MSVEVEHDGELALITLDRPPVNALDVDFLVEIAERTREVEGSDAKAAVITGKGMAFSAGADLFAVLESDANYVREAVGSLSHAFGSLFEFSKPLVAAVNGHAIAGGCIIACTADYRIMGEGSGKIGVSELRVGVPFPAYALEIVRFAAAPQHLQEMVYTGRSYDPEDAIPRGLIDEIVEPARVLERAKEVARRFATIPAETFGLIKQALRRPTVELVHSYAEQHDAEARELWGADHIRSAIREFIERTIGSARSSS